MSTLFSLVITLTKISSFFWCRLGILIQPFYWDAIQPQKKFPLDAIQGICCAKCPQNFSPAKDKLEQKIVTFFTAIYPWKVKIWGYWE